MPNKSNIKQTSSGTIKYSESNIRVLIDRFKNGDRKTFKEIWEMVRPFIGRLMRRGLDWNTATDLAGDVAMALYERGIREYDPQKCSFITWVYQIALNKKLNEFKRFKPVFFSEIDSRAKEASGQPAHITIIDRQRPDNKTPLNILIEKEDGEIRRKALHLLPKLLVLLSPDEQYLIYASIYEGQSDEEIAVILEGNNTLCEKYKKIRQRALKKLGRLFLKHGIRNMPLKN